MSLEKLSKLQEAKKIAETFKLARLASSIDNLINSYVKSNIMIDKSQLFSLTKLAKDSVNLYLANRKSNKPKIISYLFYFSIFCLIITIVLFFGISSSFSILAGGFTFFSYVSYFVVNAQYGANTHLFSSRLNKMVSLLEEAHPMMKNE